MHDLTTTSGIVAIAACAVAAVALIGCLTLWTRMRDLQHDQQAILGDRREDLVGRVASLQRQFEALDGYVQDAAGQVNGRVEAVEDQLEGTVAYRGLVHYDAYGEMSGRQSTSIALLDRRRSGIVLSSIHHRDSARLYAKQVHEGRSDVELSPEEDEAVRLALSGARQGGSVQ